MIELCVPHFLDSQHIMDILSVILSSLEPLVRLNINPPHQVDEHLALLPFASLWSWVRNFLLQGPSIEYCERLGTVQNRPHLVDRGHYLVFTRVGKRGGKIEENDFSSADFTVGTEGGGRITGRAEGDVEDRDGLFIVNDTLKVIDVGIVASLSEICQ